MKQMESDSKIECKNKPRYPFPITDLVLESGHLCTRTCSRLADHWPCVLLHFAVLLRYFTDALITMSKWTNEHYGLGTKLTYTYKRSDHIRVIRSGIEKKRYSDTNKKYATCLYKRRPYFLTPFSYSNRACNSTRSTIPETSTTAFRTFRYIHHT